MRFWQWLLMILGWWSAGLIACWLLLSALKISNPCPKARSIKCWIASIIAVAYGLGYYSWMGLKAGFTSLDFLVSMIVAALVAAACGRIICPL